jgi:hypothetical protein
MTKDELKEKIKTLVKQVYKPEVLSIDTSEKITLDAPKFPVLEKFPELKEIIINLLTNQYEIFVSDIQWVAPKPTTFRVVLGNGENFMLTYSPRSWVAQIEGKKYYLLNLSEEEAATEAIARILAYGIAEEKTEPGAEGEAAAETPVEEPAAEEPAPEEEA